MSTQTLNQVRRELTDFARSHGQIFTAKFSKQSELLNGGDIKYWAFYYDVKPMRVQGRTLLMPFTGWIANRVHPEKDNEAEVWSDATQIACDVLGFLSSDDRDYGLQDGSDIRPFTNATGDITAGVEFDFTLVIPFAFNRCDTPTTAVGYLITEEGETFITDNTNENIQV